MDTLQIVQSRLEEYIDAKVGKDRVDFLLSQAKEQIDEIATNSELFEEFLDEVDAPKECDSLILWILFFSNEYIVRDYVNTFSKEFKKVLPMSDLADLLIYAIYLHKSKKGNMQCVEHLLEYEDDGLESVDQYAFSNILLYVQKLKEPQIEF
jgi:hypothetical protein